MSPGKIWIMKRVRFLLPLMPALALAMPAFAQGTAPVLSDSQEKGSLIVFPKFVRGTVALPEGGTAPRTEIEVQVDCPVAFTCAEHQPVKIRFHWVCPSSEADQANSFVCRETDFDVTATVFEKIVFTPDGGATSPSGLPNHVVPAAECPRGYLIGWVIRPTDDAAIKFDALTGDGVLRAASGTAVAAYPAIPVQAHPALANMAVIAANGAALPIDGLPGHYTAVTGRVIGDIRYANTTTGPTFTEAAITLLTLDVRSNRPNNPVFVDLDFFGGNPSVFGNENQLSTFTEFICWSEQAVDVIDASLTQVLMGRKGTWESGPATKLSINGIPDTSGPATLLGLVEIFEGHAAPFTDDRTYITELSNDSIPVPTFFVPTPSPIPPVGSTGG